MSWQAWSEVIALAIALTGTVLIVRNPRLGTIVVAFVLFGIAEAGYTAFAVSPGPVFGVGVTWPLTVTANAGIVVVIAWALVVRRRRRGRCLPCVATIVLFTTVNSAILIQMEPVYAVASMAVVALWLLVWIPPQLRTTRQLNRTRIEAPAEVVYDNLVDTTRWPLYRDDIEVLSVEPPGPLSAGSQFVARVPGPGNPSVTFTVKSALRPRSYTVVAADMPRDTYRVDLASDGAETRMTVAATDFATYPQAVLGRAVDLWRATLGRGGGESRRLARFRQFVESGTSQ